jgi:hypothetical protein
MYIPRWLGREKGEGKKDHDEQILHYLGTLKTGAL